MGFTHQATMTNLVVVLGDLHMPHRAVGLPRKFQELLQPNKIKQIICTGNLCGKETMDYFKSVCPDVVCTRGDFDDLDFNETETFTIGELKFGLCDGKFFLNPGSATGAYNGLTSESVPTFLLMNIRGAQLQVWIYEYQGEDQQVKVEKITYTKGMESNA